MSNRAINKIYSEALAKDKKLRKNVDRWERFGWTEYEHRRAEKVKKVVGVGRVAVFVGLAFMGISMPEA